MTFELGPGSSSSVAVTFRIRSPMGKSYTSEIKGLTLVEW